MMSEKKIEDLIDDEKDADDKKEESKSGTTIDLGKIFGADSPDKKVSEYRNHALNWDGKDSTGRIIRGTEGMLGGLDKAILDVIVGCIQKVNEFLSKPKEGD